MKLQEIRATLDALGVRPSKGLGQNFLHDHTIARWIVEQLGVEQNTPVLEIGPGLGALTDVLAGSGVPLRTIEKDSRLAAFLTQRYAGKGVDVIHADAVDFDPRTLFPLGPLRLLGNLPYSATSPVLFRHLSEGSPVVQAIIMVQRELALRLSARPSTPDYGGLTLLIGRRWRVEYLRTIPPDVFYPAPRVDSSVVRLTRRAPEEQPPCDGALFAQLVKSGFSQRRKQLHKLLKDAVPDIRGHFATLRFAPTTRAEELDLASWIALTREVSGTTRQVAQEPDAEVFDVVDDKDRVCGRASRREVHVNKLRHRAVHVFLFNKAGDLLLQNRSSQKDHFPGRWDSSAAGHVEAGDDYAPTARREIEEELGIAADLEEIARLPASDETGQEFVRLYRGTHRGPFRIAPMEIECVVPFPVSVIETWLSKRPEDFAPGFRACFRAWTKI